VSDRQVKLESSDFDIFGWAKVSTTHRKEVDSQPDSLTLYHDEKSLEGEGLLEVRNYRKRRGC